jgi:ketosteroid isomerase-like protein
MSQENVEIVRAAYEPTARGDFTWADLQSAIVDDFEFVTSPELPDAGTYRGKEAIAWMRAWVESFDDLTMEATEIIDGGDKVVVGLYPRGKPRGSQTVVEGRWWQALTLRDGLIVRSETYPERGQALEAAGLSE